MTWQQLADEANAFATYLEGRGENGEVWRNKARLYSRAETAAQMTAKTGVFHCTCCLKPWRDYGRDTAVRH